MQLAEDEIDKGVTNVAKLLPLKTLSVRWLRQRHVTPDME